MAATTYTGNGSTQTISNTVNTVSFQPDLVWVKNRSNAVSHALVDSVRGAPNQLASDLTSAQNSGGNDYTLYGGVSALSAAGFTASSGTDPTYKATNGSGQTYVGWQWKAGGTTVTNGTGTISSQVRANTTAGFSVSTFTTPASGAFTFGHGLGVVPSMVIVKRRSNASSWGVWHTSLSGGTYYVLLDSTAAQANDSTVFTATPTVSVVNMGSAWATTGAQTAVAYCWAPVAGYSAFGSYTGNGSADGPFIYTGFRPRWIMIKRTDATLSWGIFDTSRNAFNVVDLQLYANLPVADNVFTTMDILSNGFKSRSATEYNTSGGTYIYAAFAENPLKYANAR